MNACDRFVSSLHSVISPWSLAPNQAQLQKLFGHYESMVQTNQTMNLTRVTDPAEAAARLYGDSLAVLPWVEQHGLHVETVLDIGSGAGFPAFPLAVMRPQWHITAMEARSKKVRFLSDAAEHLKVANLRCIHGRAEDSHRQPNAKVELVMLKAVGSLGRCLAWARGWLKDGGAIVVFKTLHLTEAEELEAAQAARRLSLVEQTPFIYSIEPDHRRLSRVLRVYRLGADGDQSSRKT